MVPACCVPETFDKALSRIHKTNYPPDWPFPADELDIWRAALDSAIGVINQASLNPAFEEMLRDQLVVLRDARRP